jgi:ribosomal protein S18 acetylase RimI-like enzyme
MVAHGAIIMLASETADTIQVRLRSAKAEDWPEISRLLDETWHAAYDAILGRMRVTLILKMLSMIGQLLNNADAATQFAFHVAQIEDRIVGMAIAAPSSCGKGAVLDMLYVLPSHQNQGIGRVLSEAAISRFPNKSFVRLAVLPKNRRAIAFYKRLGYREARKSFHFPTLTMVLNMHKVVER